MIYSFNLIDIYLVIYDDDINRPEKTDWQLQIMAIPTDKKPQKFFIMCLKK